MILLEIVGQQPSLAYIIGAVGTVIAGLGLKELWPYLFNKGQTQCEKNIIRLSSHIAVILTIIREDYGDDPAIQKAMDDVQKIIEEINK